MRWRLPAFPFTLRPLVKRPKTASCCGDDAQFSVAQAMQMYTDIWVDLHTFIVLVVLGTSHFTAHYIKTSKTASLWTALAWPQCSVRGRLQMVPFQIVAPLHISHHNTPRARATTPPKSDGITVFQCNAPTGTWKQGRGKSPSAEYQRKFDKNPSKRNRGSLSASWLSKCTPLWTKLICVYPQLPGRMPWDLCTRSLPSLQGNYSLHRYSSTYLSSKMLSKIH